MKEFKWFRGIGLQTKIFPGGGAYYKKSKRVMSDSPTSPGYNFARQHQISSCTLHFKHMLEANIGENLSLVGTQAEFLKNWQNWTNRRQLRGDVHTQVGTDNGKRPFEGGWVLHWGVIVMTNWHYRKIMKCSHQKRNIITNINDEHTFQHRTVHLNFQRQNARNTQGYGAIRQSIPDSRVPTFSDCASQRELVDAAQMLRTYTGGQLSYQSSCLAEKEQKFFGPL